MKKDPAGRGRDPEQTIGLRAQNMGTGGKKLTLNPNATGEKK